MIDAMKFFLPENFVHHFAEIVDFMVIDRDENTASFRSRLRARRVGDTSYPTNSSGTSPFPGISVEFFPFSISLTCKASRYQEIRKIYPG